MNQKQNNQVGLWVDNKNTLVIGRPEENEGGDFSVLHKIEAEHYHGEKGEHASMNAEPQYLLKYHKAISKVLLNQDEILVFGPGKAQEQLVNFLREDNHFNSKKITIESAQHMSDHQMVAKVRDFFS
ncbi:MAG TPA: hypothetical protein VFG10_12595 [Saprospiraceae bacterium]|nr:hypothetical protein [Saprospiraceae bacterium]